MAALRMPVVTSKRSRGKRASSERGKGVRSRMATTTPKGASRSASAASSATASRNTTTSAAAGRVDQSAYDSATPW
jgi:hypothetical protein